MEKLSYLDENGNTIFNSQFYKNRGTCCKSGCLHCPYGYTLNEFGLKTVNIDEKNEDMAKGLYEKLSHNTSSIESSLLAGAFGKPKNLWNKDIFSFITLKGHICGIVKIIDNEVKEIYLKEKFRDQGIKIEHVLID